MLRCLAFFVSLAVFPLAAAAEYDEAAKKFEGLFTWTFSDARIGGSGGVRNIFHADARTEACILSHTTTREIDGVVSQAEVVKIDLTTVDVDSVGTDPLAQKYGWDQDPPYSWSVFMWPRDRRGSPVSRTIFLESMLIAPENASCAAIPCTLEEATNSPFIFPRDVMDVGTEDGLAAAVELIGYCQ